MNGIIAKSRKVIGFAVSIYPHWYSRVTHHFNRNTYPRKNLPAEIHIRCDSIVNPVQNARKNYFSSISEQIYHRHKLQKIIFRLGYSFYKYVIIPLPVDGHMLLVLT
jgi:hypothetical protein